MTEDFPKRITKWEEVAALIAADALTAAEMKVIAAVKAGEVAELGEAVPSEPSDDVRVRAALLRYFILGGCEKCEVAESGVRVWGAWIEGVLNLDFATSCGHISFVLCYIRDRVQLLQSRIAFLNLTGCRLSNEIFAQGAKVTGGLIMRHLECEGEIVLTSAQIGGQLVCDSATLRNPAGTALDVQGAHVKDSVFLHNVEIEGEINLSGTEIDGQLSCEGATLRNASGVALNAERAQLKGSVFLRKVESEGQISLSGAEIGGALSFKGATLRNAEGDALNVQGAQVTGDLFLHNVEIEGGISLSGAVIGGQLVCIGAKLRNAEGKAFQAQRLTVKDGFYWRKVTEVVGAVDLNSAHFADLVADKTSWDLCDDLFLADMTYDTLTDDMNTPQRLRWVERGAVLNGEFHPQPYEQLATVLRKSGHRGAARDVLLAKEVEQRRATKLEIQARFDAAPLWQKPFLAPVTTLREIRLEISSLLLGSMAGYGYKPQRSAYWLAVLICIGAYLSFATWNAGDFAPNSDVILVSEAWQTLAEDEAVANPAAVWSDVHAPGQDYATFNPIFYGIDVVVPIIAIGQEAAWAPSTNRGPWGRVLWLANPILTILGWLVTAIGAAAVTGVIRND